MRIVIDTNVLVYAAGLQDLRRQQRAVAILQAVGEYELFLPVQVLGEFYHVLKRKFRLETDEATRILAEARLGANLIATSEQILDRALELAELHQFDVWDGIILAAAAEARCDILLSEDGHSGFVWRGVTVVDPFASELHPMAVHLLKGF